FFNDTAWIESSQPSLQQTINIFNGFFNLNDININGDKSEVIVINAKRQHQTSDGIVMGTDQYTVKPAANNQLIRYLGVWFSFKLFPKHQQRIARQEIDSIVNIIRTKRPMVDQVIYINNRVLIPRLEYRMCTTLFS